MKRYIDPRRFVLILWILCFIVPFAFRVPPLSDVLYSVVFLLCGLAILGFWLSDKYADLKSEKRYFENREKEAES